MRSHGTDVYREIYKFGKKGEPVYDAIEKMIGLRYSLLPYIYSTSWEVSNRQSSFMRALMMDFVDDRKVWDINDEYMFGKSILVAPITHAQYTPEAVVKVSEEEGWNRDGAKKTKTDVAVDFMETKSTNIYLPAGTLWYDFWTNEKHEGGKEITKETTLDVIPLYVKAGSIIPVGPQVQYATEKPWDHLELKVYAGANGNFILYEDEFDNYNYEKGVYTEIPISWNNTSRKLTIGARKGAYEGMLKNRKFTVTLQDGTQKNVDYNGKGDFCKVLIVIECVIISVEKNLKSRNMMKFFIVMAMLLGSSVASAENKQITSPDGKLVVTVSDVDGRPSYSVSYDNVLFFEAISIGDDCKYRRFFIRGCRWRRMFQPIK